MSERKLASVREIREILPIEKADSLELALIDGWKVVVKKGEFKPGDHCVYCEIDSILPDIPEFEFLKPRKHRIKTIKLRGQLSQGIAFPVNILDIFGHGPVNPDNLKPGDDVTELMGVTKYELPVTHSMNAQSKGYFPGFLRKTDEERIQNCSWIIEKYGDQPWYITEKLDGTSFTAYYNQDDFGVCSRNLELEEGDNLYWRIAKELDLEFALKMTRNLAVQGEIIGPGIQGNIYNLDKPELYLFNIYDIDTGQYGNLTDLLWFCHAFKIKNVPLLDMNINLPGSVDEILEMADGDAFLNPKAQREGLVFRPMQELEDIRHGRVSFKAISNQYLLKQEN